MEIYGADLNGIDGQMIKFTATIDEDRQGATLLGVAQKVVKEGYIRATKAIETLKGGWQDIISGYGYTIQLTPSESPKNSSGLDLPIAIMLLYAGILQNEDKLTDHIKKLQKEISSLSSNPKKVEKKNQYLEKLKRLTAQREIILKYKQRLKDNESKYLLIGSLEIVSGKLLPPEHGFFGMLSSAEKGFTAIVPEDCEIHSALIAKSRKGEVKIIKAKDLQEAWDVILRNSAPRSVSYNVKQIKKKHANYHIPDMNAVKGVAKAKKALIVAIAGGHNILFIGPPGQGKSMLAMAAINLLPAPTHQEMFEINKIYSAKGELRTDEVMLSRPYEEVSNATEKALFGGGTKPPLPGIVSLAHNGILFYDEINICPPNIIDKLRTVLSNRVVEVQRLHWTIEYPSSFILIAAMNPCKCGYRYHYECPICKLMFVHADARCDKHPHVMPIKKCKCQDNEINRYQNRIPEPLLDRIDMKVLVSSHDNQGSYDYSTQTVKRQIEKARAIQQERLKRSIHGLCNAQIPDESEFNKYTPPLTADERSYVEKIKREYNLTLRMETKVLLVSRTIADLDEKEKITIKDINEAVDLMGLSGIE